MRGKVHGECSASRGSTALVQERVAHDSEDPSATRITGLWGTVEATPRDGHRSCDGFFGVGGFSSSQSKSQRVIVDVGKETSVRALAILSVGHIFHMSG